MHFSYVAIISPWKCLCSSFVKEKVGFPLHDGALSKFVWLKLAHCIFLCLIGFFVISLIPPHGKYEPFKTPSSLYTLCQVCLE